MIGWIKEMINHLSCIEERGVWKTSNLLHNSMRQLCLYYKISFLHTYYNTVKEKNIGKSKMQNDFGAYKLYIFHYIVLLFISLCKLLVLNIFASFIYCCLYSYHCLKYRIFLTLILNSNSKLHFLLFCCLNGKKSSITIVK